MSADNMVAILKTPNGKDGFEYRVTHVQAIENITYNNPKGNPKQVVNYFGKCKVFTDKNKAYQLANSIEKEILDDDFCPILEYGINEITLPHTFSYYIKRRYNKKTKKRRYEKADQDKKVLVNKSGNQNRNKQKNQAKVSGRKK